LRSILAMAVGASLREVKVERWMSGRREGKRKRKRGREGRARRT